MSRLIFLYGPPGVGKLTVAKEISKLLEFKIFHNHLSGDIAYLFGPFGTPNWKESSYFIREYVFTNAVKRDTDLIFTYCYEKDADDKYINHLIDIYGEKNIYFVQLKAEINTVYERSESSNRKKYNKIVEREKIKDLLSKVNLTSTISFVKSLIIDTTNLSASETAKQIADYVVSK